MLTTSEKGQGGKWLNALSVSKPTDPSSYRSIHSTLFEIVCLSLDSDPKLIPRSAPTLGSASSSSSGKIESDVRHNNNDEEDDDDENTTSPDDFTLMDEKQAKRIASLANLSFDVDLSTDVVIADANVGALARRVLGARSLVG